MEKYKRKNLLGQKGIWQYDRKARAYYLHHFLKEEPDLNVANSKVREEIRKIMGFWLQMGVCGFRIDAAHILVKEIGEGKVHAEKLTDILDEMRSFIKSRNSDAVLLAEANVPIPELHTFFEGERMDLLFNFVSNQDLFLSMVRKKAAPLREGLRKLRAVKGQWVNFLRHHDELNLELLSAEERDEVFEAYAPRKNMRSFGHGIRRRLPPMLDGDQVQLKFMYALMFGLPGIPLINYGEEILMGDDLSRKGRLSVRTVMQWSSRANGGFTRAKKITLRHPLIKKGPFEYRKNNVDDQQADPDSFLNWMERLISTRKQCPHLSHGKWELPATGNAAILAICCLWQHDQVLLVYNFDDKVQTFKFRQKPRFSALTQILGDSDYEEPGKDGQLRLNPFGFRWFRGDNY